MTLALVLPMATLVVVITTVTASAAGVGIAIALGSGVASHVLFRSRLGRRYGFGEMSTARDRSDSEGRTGMSLNGEGSGIVSLAWEVKVPSETAEGEERKAENSDGDDEGRTSGDSPTSNSGGSSSENEGASEAELSDA